MRFKVTRTSIYDRKPCDEAYKDRAKTWDRRTTPDEESWNRKFPNDPWREKGFDFGTWEGGIKRAFLRDHWFIDLDGEEALFRLVDAYGSVVLSRAEDLDDTYEIEIYDDYRE